MIKEKEIKEKKSGVKEMHIDTVETLHAQHDKGEKWDYDLLIHTILDLLAGPLNDDNYRNLSPEDIREEIVDNLKHFEGTRYEKRSKRIIRKISKLSTRKDIILYLGEIILSD